MKKIFVLSTLLLAAVMIQAQQQRVNLRGLVRTTDPVTHSSVPLPKISVDLFRKQANNENWQLIASAYTDESGFYYFINISLGSYYIQINKRKNYDISVTPIDERRQSFLDIPVLKY